MNVSQIFSILFFILSIANASGQSQNMPPKNEFRAVWIATVVNIDWPKTSTDSLAQQQKDFIAILDAYQALNYNAVIVQIRSSGEAFYPTKLAPWSRYLTGQEGKAPQNNFDILHWMIDQCHTRGFEFHAWLNPYRATMDTDTAALSKTHDYFLHPDWMIKYGEVGKEKWYYNPGLPEVQAHLLKIVEEVVETYDIDAVHFDDYFYPYKVAGKEFKDTASYRKFSGGISIGDWRRGNVNAFVKAVSESIKKIKPWVQFGISPFGVWRNKSVDPRGSDTEAGQTNYDDLYADPLFWMQNGWIDYIVPQLYWSLDHPKASHAKLLQWWADNTINANLYIGNGTYKINNDSDKKWQNPLEIPNQIDAARRYKNIQGNAFFSAKWFLGKHQNVTAILSKNQYQYQSIPSPVPALKKDLKEQPVLKSIEKEPTCTSFYFEKPTQNIRYLVVYKANENEKLDINKASQIYKKIPLTLHCDNVLAHLATQEKNTNFGFSFIDKSGNESALTLIP